MFDTDYDIPEGDWQIGLIPNPDTIRPTRRLFRNWHIEYGFTIDGEPVGLWDYVAKNGMPADPVYTDVTGPVTVRLSTRVKVGKYVRPVSLQGEGELLLIRA